MKNITFILVLAVTSVFSQTISKPKAKEFFEFKGKYSLYAFKPLTFGDNYLAKGHKNGDLSIGFEIQVFELNKIGFSFGGNFSTFAITDTALVGNANKTNFTSFFGKATYVLPVTNQFSLAPFLGAGSAIYTQKVSKKELGSQRGTSFYLGSNLIYSLDKTFSIYVGAEYQVGKMKTVTNAEFVNFFNNLNQVNFRLGILLQ